MKGIHRASKDSVAGQMDVPGEMKKMAVTAVVIKAKATHAAQTKAENKQLGERKEMQHRCQLHPWLCCLQLSMM